MKERALRAQFKKFGYDLTGHAEDRILERKIELLTILDVLKSGRVTVELTRLRRIFEKGELRVVTDPFKTTIITAMYITRESL